MVNLTLLLPANLLGSSSYADLFLMILIAVSCNMLYITVSANSLLM